MEAERASQPQPSEEEDQAEVELQRRLSVPKKHAPGKRITKGKAKGLTENEKQLADLVAGGMTGKDAALEVYNTDNPASAAAIASEVLAKPDVRAYLESVAMKAAGKMTELMDTAKSEMVQYVAAKDILDRTGFKTPEPAKDPNQGATYNFIFSGKTQEEIREIEDRIRARLLADPNETQHAQETAEDVETVQKEA